MGHLRIVAGELRGHRLRVPPGAGVRPTTDRVREALFSILGEAVRGSSVLDLYCGSGALGLEALSRGAASAVFLDRDRRCLSVARENAERLGVTDRADFVLERAARWLERHDGGSFGLILADPPYDAHEERERLLRAAPRLVSPTGLVVIERPSRDRTTPDPTALVLQRSAAYGDSTLDIYRLSGAD